MRKLIIDTDTASDDAVALIMALKSKDIQIEAITTVAGNVPVNVATRNALATIEVAGDKRPPVYVGADKPLVRDLFTSTFVHGADGMGDKDLIHPTIKEESGYAVDKILEIVEKNANDIEIVSIGPVTNIALAILKDRKIMSKVSRIYSMGTAGMGKGNITPVAEFNVIVDAEAYKIMMDSKIPITIIGYDMCVAGALSSQEVTLLKNSGNKVGEFVIETNQSSLDFTQDRHNEDIMIIADSVAMGVYLWRDVVIKSKSASCYVCVIDPPTYGQVIIDDDIEIRNSNAALCEQLNATLFKERMIDLLLS